MKKLALAAVLLGALFIFAACQGAPGVQGSKGDTGPAPSQEELVKLVNQAISQRLDELRGPQGERGLRGDTGSKGDRGDQGPVGGPLPLMAVTFNQTGSTSYVNTGPLLSASPDWKGWAKWVPIQSVTITTPAQGWVYVVATGQPELGSAAPIYPVSVGISRAASGPPEYASSYWARYNTNVMSAYSVSHAYCNETAGMYTYWVVAGGLDSRVTGGTMTAIYVGGACF